MRVQEATEILTAVKDEYRRSKSLPDHKAADAVEFAINIIYENAELEKKLENLQDEYETLKLRNEQYMKDISLLNDKLKHQEGEISAFKYCLECIGGSKGGVK